MGKLGYKLKKLLSRIKKKTPPRSEPSHRFIFDLDEEVMMRYEAMKVII